MDLPLAGLTADAEAVRSVLDELDGDTVLVGHSYGGVVISEAAAGRRDLAHLVYLAAFLVPPGEDGLGHVTPALSAAIVFGDENTITVDPDHAADLFYGHCDSATAHDAIARLRPMPRVELSPRSSARPWQEVPTTYVVCTDDGAIHPDGQRAMSEHAHEVRSLEADHSPFLSMPDQLAQLLLEVATPR